MVGLHNFGSEGAVVPLTVPDLPSGTRLVDLLGERRETEVGAGGAFELDIQPYGYRWLLVVPEGEDPGI